MTERELYLNHAGTSWPKPQVVTEAVRDAMSVAPGRWAHRFDEAHQALAEFFGVGRREQLLLTPGCTSSLAVGIGDAHVPSGKRVLTSQWEHHALHRPLLKRALGGVRIDYIPSKRDPSPAGRVSSIDLEWLERELAEQDVGLVALTAACNVTGELLPCAEVIRMAHACGAMVLIDAAQTVGWLDLDLLGLGADMVAFGGHKGLQGPWGIGGLYFSDQAQMECVSATCGLSAAGGGESYRTPRPGYCDVGSVDQFALAGLHAAIEMLRTQDREVSLARARQQIRRIRQTLLGIEGAQVFGGSEEGMPSIAVAIGAVPSSDVATRLQEHGLVVGAGMHCAPLAHEALGTTDTGLVRLSVGAGQADEEINEAMERLASALDGEFVRRGVARR